MISFLYDRDHFLINASIVLDGCGRAYKAAMVEKGEMAVASTSSSEIDVSVHRALGWFMVIWVPMVSYSRQRDL